MKNIVLFGGSNSVMVNGLQAGLKEYANVTNLALGGTPTIQNLYELCRERNQEALKNADLIVTESNVNDAQAHFYFSKSSGKDFSLEVALKHLELYYSKLYSLNKPVCILILPYFTKRPNSEKIYNMHRVLANHFGFSVIDQHALFLKNELIIFRDKFGAHQLATLQKNLGKHIAKNIDMFKTSNKKISLFLPEFRIVLPNELDKHGNFKIFNPKNSAFNEEVYRLEKGNLLSFNKLENWYLIGIHAWNLNMDGSIRKLDKGVVASFVLKYSKNQIVKALGTLNSFCAIHDIVKIDNDTKLFFNHENLSLTEYASYADMSTKFKEFIGHFDLIALLLCKPYNLNSVFSLDDIPNDEIVEIEHELDFSYLAPNAQFYNDSMEFIDEYITWLYPQIRNDIENSLLMPLKITIKNLEEQIDELKNLDDSKIKELENKLEKIKSPHILTAKERIENQLSYKLGKAMVENSSTLKDFLNLPFLLLKIKKAHKVYQNQPDIKTLPDYKEALKYKNHLSYKLGSALIEASKNWYKGGFIKLIFEINKIKKEHKNRILKKHPARNSRFRGNSRIP